MKLKSLLINQLITLNLILFGSSFAIAVDQPLDDQEILNVENLYSTPPSPPPAAESKTTTTTTTTTTSSETGIRDETAPGQRPNQMQRQHQEQQEQHFKNLTELNQLAPFSEVSVIQKKFLPKTERFQLFGGLSMVTNSPWFLNIGGKLSLSYNFTESLGVELGGVFMSSSQKEVSKEIHDQHDLEPDLFVNTKAYYGADFVWTPIYGKISLLNEKIIPFDMYFSGGFGMSNTNSQEGTVPTFHVGTGQIFALNKAWAIRWDFSWTFFSATPVAAAGSTNKPMKNTYNDLILSAGVSFFFPEAKYR